MTKDFSSEFKYKTSRSSGAGGQNVNKVETSVSVLWNIEESSFFSENQKKRISEKLLNKINAGGILQVTSSVHRTQFQNKKTATTRMLEMVSRSLIIPKKRVKTKPSRAQIERRLKTKKSQSEKKENRKFRF